MGKKRRLNRFISKWLKSDLPDDRSTVLLLGVTRIPTSPVAARRPCSLPLVPAVAGRLHRRNSSGAGKKGAIVRRNSSRKAAPVDCRRHQVPSVDSSSAVETPTPTPTPSSERCSERSPRIRAVTPPVRCVAVVNDASRFAAADAMERSVDSIGTCSLDVDASADLSDWSEISSAGTLRSASVVTPTFPEPHLPSYLSLACTINGYSTTTHYDPIRFAAKSRDASPHRIDTDLTPNRPTTTYSVHNNLLSPPNLVPLPHTIAPTRMEKALAQQHLHGEFYSSMSTKKYISKETFTSSLFSGIGLDTTDGCVDSSRRSAHSKCVSYESKSVTTINGQSKCVSETSVGQQFENGQETKSFIQQRVERLYGPGALAQGFFKPQKKRVSDIEDKSSCADLRSDGSSEPAMRQSTSSPTLPVLRHLRPEFRAQLPFISPKKGVTEGAMQKSVTVPALKEEGKVNGCGATQLECPKKEETNGLGVEAEVDEAERDGHYFLRVLDAQSKRLLELATRVENYMNIPNLSEDVIGILRAASGKARLLVMQKIQQFKGLCTNNINRDEDEEYPTNNQDLQGFWDMVMLQVDQVDAIFRDIEVLRANGWQEVAATVPEPAAVPANPRRPVVRSPPRPRSAASEEARKQREAQRRQIIEDRRRSMRIAQQLQRQENEPSIEIFAPESTS